MTIFTNRQILGIKCEKFTADNRGESNRKTSKSLNEWDSYPEFLNLSYAIEICSSMCSFASPIACTVHRPSVEFSKKKKRKTSEDRLRTDIFQEGFNQLEITSHGLCGYFDGSLSPHSQ